MLYTMPGGTIIDNTKNGLIVRVRINTIFTIRLPACAQEYYWLLDSDGSEGVRLLDSYPSSNNNGLGMQQWRFLAAIVGETTIRLVCKRTWDDQSVRAFRVTIKVVLKEPVRSSPPVELP